MQLQNVPRLNLTAHASCSSQSSCRSSPWWCSYKDCTAQGLAHNVNIASCLFLFFMFLDPRSHSGLCHPKATMNEFSRKKANKLSRFQIHEQWYTVILSWSGSNLYPASFSLAWRSQPTVRRTGRASRIAEAVRLSIYTEHATRMGVLDCVHKPYHFIACVLEKLCGQFRKLQGFKQLWSLWSWCIRSPGIPTRTCFKPPPMRPHRKSRIIER